jgi:hypothetical protein
LASWPTVRRTRAEAMGGKGRRHELGEA